MATGRLGSADLSATTNTTVYTVPTTTVASFNISVCNRNSTIAKVRLALCDTSTPGNDEYIEYDQAVPANGVLERTGVILDASKLVVAYSDSANVSVVVTGVEESTA